MQEGHGPFLRGRPMRCGNGHREFFTQLRNQNLYAKSLENIKLLILHTHTKMLNNRMEMVQHDLIRKKWQREINDVT
jgi:hypothetical protein